jgi:hypothetical protein
MMIPAAIFYGLRFTTGELRLIRNSHQPKLKEGKRIAVFGNIHPSGEPLQTPFSKQDCIAYMYGVYYWKRNPQAKHSSQEYEYSGQAMIPSVIRSNAGDLKLLSFFQGTESKEYEPEDLETKANAEAYLRSTSSVLMKSFDWKTKLGQFKELMMESDGYLKQDWRMTSEPLNLNSRFLEESYLKPGGPYCVIGVFSAGKMGIYGDPLDKGAITLLEGNQEQAAKTMRAKVILTIIIGLFLTAFINFFLYGFLK